MMASEMWVEAPVGIYSNPEQRVREADKARIRKADDGRGKS
jgi:hypothetical protein